MLHKKLKIVNRFRLKRSGFMPGRSPQSQSRPIVGANRALFRIARICERYQVAAAGGIGRACFPLAYGRYKRWEVGGGRATRQPGQVRKEAALTSAVRVARQPPTHCFAAPRLRRHFRGERSRAGRMQLERQNRPTTGRLVHCFQVMLPSCEPLRFDARGARSEGRAQPEARF